MEAAEYITLSDLPRGHPLRTASLASINAEYLSGLPPAWKSLRTFKIGKSSYDDLGPVWTDTGYHCFRAPK